MKTDRFADIIRRKLESIRPEFTDKDWARMQATLNKANLSSPDSFNPNNPFSGGVWSGKTWLMAAASVSTVALLSYSIWQHREINELKQTIGHLHQKPDSKASDEANVTATSPKPDAISANRNEGQSIRPDTVYITRYVPRSSRAKPDIRSDEHVKYPENASTPQLQPVQESSSVTKRQSLALNQTYQTELNEKNSTSSPELNSSNEINLKNTTNTPLKTTEVERTKERSTIEKEQVAHQSKSVKDQLKVTDNGRDNRSERNSGNTTPGISENGVTQLSDAQSENRSDQSAINEQLNVAELSGLSLSMKAKNWEALLAQRAKRMRPARTVLVAAEPSKAPENQTRQNAVTRFRVGVGGDFFNSLWNAGIYTEALLGRHWILSSGINKAMSTQSYVTEDDFNKRTKHDFRQEFVRPSDIKRDLLNIETQLSRFQIPITLGYRIPLNQSISLIASAGTFLNLSNSETIAYSCLSFIRPPQKPQFQIGLDEVKLIQKPPVALINTVTLGTGVEWQQGHWVAQASPLLSVKTRKDHPLDLNWQDKTAFSLRLRLLYQF